MNTVHYQEKTPTYINTHTHHTWGFSLAYLNQVSIFFHLVNVFIPGTQNSAMNPSFALSACLFILLFFISFLFSLSFPPLYTP